MNDVNNQNRFKKVKHFKTTCNGFTIRMIELTCKELVQLQI